MSRTAPGDPPRAVVPAAEPAVAAIAVAGLVALAVAMGIGRFAFTPLLPMMLHDGVVDLPAASWLASANYFGYLVGALVCTFQPRLSRRLTGRTDPVDGPRLARAGLVATAVLTLAMALPLPTAWPLLRFAAGMASAIVFVHTSGWCLAELGRRGAAAMGGVIYAGPGAGIVASGLCASAMVAAQWRAAGGWLFHGALALLLTASVWRTLRSRVGSAATAAAETGVAAPARRGGEVAWLATAYGLAGFGYIVTATFLPVIARGALPRSAWLDLFWPIFGLGVTCGALLTTRVRIQGDLRLSLAAAYAIQALGIGAGLWWPTLGGFAVGSLLLGLPFTAITFFAMQEVRRLRPDTVAPSIGLLTALYGIGQTVGPPMVARLLARNGTAAAGFDAALGIAAGALLVGAALFLGMVRAYPKRPG